MEHQRNIDLVNDLLKQPAETPWLEFKHNLWDPKKIGQTVSALSNSARYCDKKVAFLLWGIEDKTRRVIGTNIGPPFKKLCGQEFEIWLATRLSPSLAFRFHTVCHPHGHVVVLEIPAPTVAPIAFDNINYIRIGSATTKLSRYPSIHQALLEKILPYGWENGVAVKYLTPDEVLYFLDHISYFRLTNTRLPDDLDNILTHLQADGLIESDVGGKWNILNLGAILFASDMEKFDTNIQKKAVRVTRYNGLNRVDGSFCRRFSSKGYASDFLELLEFLNGQIPQTEKVDEPPCEPRSFFPPIAIRELVANALVHQDMTITGDGPRIDVFNDRIEITNPGGSLISPNRMIDQPPQTRNNALVSLMRRMGMCEDEGSGMDKVFSKFEEYNLPAPQLLASQHSMGITARGPCNFDQMTNEERINTCYWHCVLKYEIDREVMHKSSLYERFCIDSNAEKRRVDTVIRNAVKLKLIRQAIEGNRKSGYKPYWA